MQNEKRKIAFPLPRGEEKGEGERKKTVLCSLRRTSPAQSSGGSRHPPAVARWRCQGWAGFQFVDSPKINDSKLLALRGKTR